MNIQNVGAKKLNRALRQVVAGKPIKKDGFCYCPSCKENLGIESMVSRMNYCSVCGKRLKE